MPTLGSSRAGDSGPLDRPRGGVSSLVPKWLAGIDGGSGHLYGRLHIRCPASPMASSYYVGVADCRRACPTAVALHAEMTSHQRAGNTIIQCTLPTGVQTSELEPCGRRGCADELFLKHVVEQLLARVQMLRGCGGSKVVASDGRRPGVAVHQRCAYAVAAERAATSSSSTTPFVPVGLTCWS